MPRRTRRDPRETGTGDASARTVVTKFTACRGRHSLRDGSAGSADRRRPDRKVCPLPNPLPRTGEGTAASALTPPYARRLRARGRSSAPVPGAGARRPARGPAARSRDTAPASRRRAPRSCPARRRSRRSDRAARAYRDARADPSRPPPRGCGSPARPSAHSASSVCNPGPRVSPSASTPCAHAAFALAPRISRSLGYSASSRPGPSQYASSAGMKPRSDRPPKKPRMRAGAINHHAGGARLAFSCGAARSRRSSPRPCS